MQQDNEDTSSGVLQCLGSGDGDVSHGCVAGGLSIIPTKGFAGVSENKASRELENAAKFKTSKR